MDVADKLIHLVGAGRMGGAMLRGWLARSVKPTSISVTEPHPAPDMERLLLAHSIAATPSRDPDVVVLAIKPQSFDDVLPTLGGLIKRDTVVLSVAAGRTITGMAHHFPAETAIVRSIPNLPAEVGRGITAAYPGVYVTPSQREICEFVLRAVGDVVWVDDEGLIDAITGLSGSGPAYVFYMVEALAAAGRAAGIPNEVAMHLARATVTGAGELMYQSTLPATQLRENVTSPNGTTAAGLAVLMGEPSLTNLMTDAVAAAATRSRELAK